MKTTKTTKHATTVQTMLTNLAKVESDLGSNPPTITSDDKRRKVKQRKGGERIVALIGSLATQHGLTSPTLDAPGMTEQQTIANNLAPVEQQLTKLLKRVSDERFVASSQAWQTALKLYAVLQRCAVNDGELAVNLAPIEAFFAYRHGDVLDTKPTKLQTRAKAKLAHAEKLAASARNRIGAEVSAPTQVATPSVQPAPVAPVAPIVQPPVPVATQMYVAPKSNGALNGAYNGGSNGATNGASSGG